MTDFKKGDIVTWSSQAAGSWKTKTGEIVYVHNLKNGHRYEVRVMPTEGSKAKPKTYYPWPSLLTLVK